MRFLIALVGDRLESLVAKNFEHAAWYVIVDGETDEREATCNVTPHDRHEVLGNAVSENVDAVIAGKFGEHTRKLIDICQMEIIQVRGMSGRAAMMKAQAGQLKQSTFADGKMKEEKSVTIGSGRPPLVRGKKPKLLLTNTGSPRGHHHIQQYGGRGH